MIISIDSRSFYSLHLRVPFIDGKEVDVLDAWFDLVRLLRTDPDIDYDGFLELAWEFISDAYSHLSIAIPAEVPEMEPLVTSTELMGNLGRIPRDLIQAGRGEFDGLEPVNLVGGACRNAGIETWGPTCPHEDEGNLQVLG